ncbi:MAG: hypothetical protein JXR70_14315 [Spirochaetales bacterium]|nr:hypothetical protein [Spirochaetales bacterium]
MLHYFKKYPVKRTKLILLIAGIAVFVPVYLLNFLVMNDFMDLTTLSKLMLSFDVNVFREIILSFETRGFLNNLYVVFLLNIISVAGFCLFMFSLNLMITRRLEHHSVIHTIGLIFAPIIILIGLMDVFPSVLFLSIARNPKIISKIMVYVIDGAYVGRMVLLGLLFIWIIISGTSLLVHKLRKKNTKTE